MKLQSQEVANELKAAPQFDVHKWSDYPEVKAVCNALFDEVIAFRKAQNPKARTVKPDQIKKHLRILLIDLYVASQGPNPWRGVSKRKEDYRKKESRYRQIFLTYDFLIPLINDLGSLGYIEEALGFLDKTTKKGFRTRIKATQKLVDLIEAEATGVKLVVKQVGLKGLVIDNPEAQRETIILRDKEGNLLEYEDTEQTKAMRHSIDIINAKLSKASIVLRVSDDQFDSMLQKLKGWATVSREPVDFTRKTLHRVFNEDFQHGGRFYGGWWIGLPKEYRKYIDINHKHTVEVDFSAHHIRMLYAWDGHEPPQDPYQIENCPYPRDVLKQVFLVLINARDKKSTILACRQSGIEEVEFVLKALEQHHKTIAKYFYSGMGLRLQFEDSVLAEEIMLRMLERGAVVLPVHDSFIVRNSYEQELREVMEQVFAERYKTKPVMKTKPTILDKDEPEDDGIDNLEKCFVTTDIDELLKKEENYTKIRKIWGEG